MKKVPPHIRQEVKSSVYKKADEHGYRRMGRVQNGIFMEHLVKDPEVGGKLADYIAKSELKTYIKDAILNRYSKDKIADELSSDAAGIIREVLGQGSTEIEAKKRLSLLRLDNGDLVILAGGTFLKWETALRKALEYVASSPGLPPKDQNLYLVLSLAIGGEPLTTGDMDHLNKALSLIGVSVFFAREKNESLSE